jgi:hypothetical protein
MRFFALGLVALLLCPMLANADLGDQWILGIHHLQQGTGPFTTNIGAGYNGPVSSGDAQYFGNSYQHSGAAGDISRIYWELSGNSIDTGHAAPTTAQLFKIDFWGVTQATGHNDYQVIESMFHGDHEANDGYPAGYPNPPSQPSPSYDADIPWVGAFGTNHQYVRASRQPLGASQQSITVGAWNGTGDGPQAPASSNFNAAGNGIYMWLEAGSRVYVKWDFGFTTNRTWSALRLTQVTPVIPNVTGDYSKNGVVDAADYAVWRKTEGQFATGLAADGNNDGFVDDYDYDLWRQRFGATSGSGAASQVGEVPEPATIWLVALLGAALGNCRKRRAVQTSI